MLFHLTTLNLARFLTEDAPKLRQDELNIQVSVLWMLRNILTSYVEIMP